MLIKIFRFSRCIETKPRERFLNELFHPDPSDPYFRSQAGKFRSELHDRLANPLYPILFVLIAGVHLAYPRTTRDSRMQSLFTAFGVAAGLRIVGLAGVNIAAKKTIGLAILWGVPVIGILVAMAMIHYEIRPLSLPSFSFRFLRRARVATEPG